MVKVTSLYPANHFSRRLIRDFAYDKRCISYEFWTAECFSVRVLDSRVLFARVLATFRTSFELLNVGRAVARSRGRSGCGRPLPLGHVETKWPARSSGIRTHIASVVAGDAVHYTRLTRREKEVKLSKRSSRVGMIHATWYTRGRFKSLRPSF